MSALIIGVIIKLFKRIIFKKKIEKIWIYVSIICLILTLSTICGAFYFVNKCENGRQVFRCLKETSNNEDGSCPENAITKNDKCYFLVDRFIVNSYCKIGKVDGNMCVAYIDLSDATISYSCPSGYTLNNNKCTKTITTDLIYEIGCGENFELNDDIVLKMRKLMQLFIMNAHQGILKN
jgi:hypothetical protein